MVKWGPWEQRLGVEQKRKNKKEKREEDRKGEIEREGWNEEDREQDL